MGNYYIRDNRMRPVIVLLALVAGVWGHGRLWDPPSRSSLWRFPEFSQSPKNWNDNELFCGGFGRQERNGGRCGTCGDPWDGVRANEAGGRYANGIISKVYQEGQVIPITVHVTANHRGWFEFNLCPVNHPSVRATQDCYDRYLLEQADGSGPRFTLTSGRTGMWTINYRLPAGLTCNQCALQWRWKTANSWGTDPDTGRQCVGCGPQEQFRGCSDVAIEGDGPMPSPTPITDIPDSTYNPTTRYPSTDPSTEPSTEPSTPVPTTSTTSSEPTPSPWPTRIEGVRCRAIGIWEGRPQFDRWCLLNCNHVPPSCPFDRCECWMEPEY